MVSGQITFQNFAYGIDDGAATPFGGGEPFPVKILVIRDLAHAPPTQMEVRLGFKPEEFEKFIDVLQSGISKIVRPHSPPIPFLKNRENL